MGHVAGSTFGIGTPATYPMQPWSLQPSLQSFPSQLAQPLPQLLQLLQILPQQLQQLQVLQQQQLLHLQQLIQLVPTEIQQIQQLIQVVSQQLQQPQQFQPLSQGISAPFGFGLTPQAFSGPAVSHVM